MSRVEKLTVIRETLQAGGYYVAGERRPEQPTLYPDPDRDAYDLVNFYVAPPETIQTKDGLQVILDSLAASLKPDQKQDITTRDYEVGSDRKFISVGRLDFREQVGKLVTSNTVQITSLELKEIFGEDGMQEESESDLIRRIILRLYPGPSYADKAYKIDPASAIAPSEWQAQWALVPSSLSLVLP
ncbi:MAG TPA: hypothetical protein VLG37_04080 [Candidatus Saccharimonadales bacterium]|nr:hypothetical protein [Candidatus Saccharimonadales bacterium]